MSPRVQFLKSLAGSFGSGAVAAAVVNAGWWLTTGGLPSSLTTLIAAEVVTGVWSAWQALQFYRSWQAVVASYRMPALGEGIEIPHRLPADDEQHDGGEPR